MAHFERQAHPALRPLVPSYVGYRDRLDPEAVHHGLPSPWATVVLTIDAPLDVGWLDEPGSRGTFAAMAAGLHPVPALIHTHGYQQGIQLSLTPRGVRALLGLPAGALGRDLVPLESVLPGSTDTLEAIREADSWDARFDLLDAALLRALGRHEDPFRDLPAEVGEAWRLIQHTGGRMPVETVARRVGWSRRYLAPRFEGEFGLAPKEAARVSRFTRARRLAESGHSLAETAAAAGYADQSHLTREWRALSGRTPTQLLASPYHLDHGEAADPRRSPRRARARTDTVSA